MNKKKVIFLTILGIFILSFMFDFLMSSYVNEVNSAFFYTYEENRDLAESFKNNNFFFNSFFLTNTLAFGVFALGIFLIDKKKSAIVFTYIFSILIIYLSMIHIAGGLSWIPTL